MKRKLIFYGFILWLSSFVLTAQQDAMFTHYMYNTLWLNPAYAGTRDALTVTGIYRSQWVGFAGAPEDQSFTAHAPFDKGKMGLGLSLQNDKIGPLKNTFIGADYSYHLKLDSKSKIAFGIKAMADFFNNYLGNLNLENQSQPDIAFTQNIHQVSPNFGAGVYYYRERFYAGFSSPKLIQHTFNGGSASYSQIRHFFLIAGYIFSIDKEWKFKPTTFIKMTKAAPIQADITANFVYDNNLTFGAMFRTSDALGVLVNYTVKEQFTIGYSFDWSFTNQTGKYNGGSHELMLRYDLISYQKSRIKSPRYF